MDIIKLTKLLAMTDSCYDNEALTAIRRANFMLKAENKTWDDVFQSKQSLPILLNSHEFPREQIEHMLVMCISRTRSKSGIEFLRSLQEFYRKTGFLTARQLESLHKWYKNI